MPTAISVEDLISEIYFIVRVSTLSEPAFPDFKAKMLVEIGALFGFEELENACQLSLTAEDAETLLRELLRRYDLKVFFEYINGIPEKPAFEISSVGRKKRKKKKEAEQMDPFLVYEKSAQKTVIHALENVEGNTNRVGG